MNNYYEEYKGILAEAATIKTIAGSFIKSDKMVKISNATGLPTKEATSATT